jgi:hypothetical protein
VAGGYEASRAGRADNRETTMKLDCKLVSNTEKFKGFARRGLAVTGRFRWPHVVDRYFSSDKGYRRLPDVNYALEADR